MLGIRNGRQLQLDNTQRGVTVSYETIRHWCQTFGLDYARKLRRRRGRLGNIWYLDEVFVTFHVSDSMSCIRRAKEHGSEDLFHDSPRIGSRIATGVWRCGADATGVARPQACASMRSLRPACRIRSGLTRRRSVVPCRAHSVGERLPGGGFLARGDAFVYDASQDRGQLDDGVHGDDFGEPAGRGQIRPPGLRCLARYRGSSSPRSGQLIR